MANYLPLYHLQDVGNLKIWSWHSQKFLQASWSTHHQPRNGISKFWFPRPTDIVQRVDARAQLEEKDNSLFIKKCQEIEYGTIQQKYWASWAVSPQRVICCWNTESAFTMGSLLVPTSAIVCWIFINIILSLFIILIPLLLIYLVILFIDRWIRIWLALV